MELILPDIVYVGIFSRQNLPRGKSITNKRTTTMFEIEIPVVEGGMSYINSEVAEIEPSLIICAKPGQVRRTELPFKCYYIHFILKRGELYERLMDIPNFVRTDNYEKYLKLFQKMYKYFDSLAEDDEIFLQSLVLELIYSLVKDSKKITEERIVKVQQL